MAIMPVVMPDMPLSDMKRVDLSIRFLMSLKVSVWVLFSVCIKYFVVQSNEVVKLNTIAFLQKYGYTG